MHTPGYRNDAIQCVVRREGGLAKGPTGYSIYLEAQNKFLMGATQARSTFQAMGINRAAHYTLSLDPKVTVVFVHRSAESAVTCMVVDASLDIGADTRQPCWAAAQRRASPRSCM